MVAVRDSSGDTAEKMKFDPYGEATVTVQDGHSATANPYLFQGRRWDDEVDLYYFRNRVMSPVLGRYLQRDGTGYVSSMNLYEYVDGGPIGYLDRSGQLTTNELVGRVLAQGMAAHAGDGWSISAYSVLRWRVCRAALFGQSRG